MAVSLELQRLSSRWLVAGALFASLGTMAPTCSKESDEKKAVKEEDEEDAERSSESKATASAAMTAQATAEATAQATAATAATADVKSLVGADPLFTNEEAFVERYDDGSVVFLVDPSGSTKVAVAGADGKPAADRSVKLFIEEAPEKETEIALEHQPDKRLYVGAVPELTATLTPVRYEISGGASPWKGILHLPPGGTKELKLTAKVAADAHAEPLEGPHGGRIERIGEDDVEILIDPDSGETRAWIIVEGRVVPPGERTISFYFDRHHIETYPDQNDSFYAKATFSADFSFSLTRKVSVVLGSGGRVHTHLFGFRPHVYFYAARPCIDVRVVGWTKEKKGKWDKNPNEPGMGWAKGKEKHEGGGSHGHVSHGGGDKGKSHGGGGVKVVVKPSGGGSKGGGGGSKGGGGGSKGGGGGSKGGGKGKK
ncbi:MAG: hypothetical protein IPM79_23090 [Polyangiaceae bacterium]|nr:hypothetical protein [Polyangiaceae bacterium]MBK8940420.1 hypothetical protein [Polyangiaceae bacterium]